MFFKTRLHGERRVNEEKKERRRREEGGGWLKMYLCEEKKKVAYFEDIIKVRRAGIRFAGLIVEAWINSRRRGGGTY